MAVSKLSTEGMVHKDNIVAWRGGVGLLFLMQETFKKPIQFECIELKLLSDLLARETSWVLL